MIDNFYHRLLFAIWLQTLPSVRQMYIINMYCHDAGMTAVILEDFINKLTERERRETEGRRVGMIGFSLLKKKMTCGGSNALGTWMNISPLPDVRSIEDLSF